MTPLPVFLLAGLAAALWPSRPSGAELLATPRARSLPDGTRPDGRHAEGWRGASSPVLAALWTRWLAARRVVASTDEVADALVLVSLALRAGLPLTEALHHVHAEATGHVRADLAAVVAALRWGRPAHEAWTFAGPGWRAAALATQLSERTGAAPASLLDRAAVRLREERERDRERAAARAGVLLVLPLGLGFLPAFACTAVVPVVLNLATGLLSGGV